MIYRTPRNRLRLLFSAMVLAAAFTTAGCRSLDVSEEPEPEVVEVESPEATTLRQIGEIYQAPACYLLNFRVRISSDGRSDEANGVVRADGVEGRMRFQFTDTMLGIPLSSATVTREIVFVRDIRHGSQTIPMSHFEVRGLGNNSIALPFHLFSSLLMTTLPDEIFDPRARRTRHEDGTLSVQLDMVGERYRYDFRENRLNSLEYLNLRTTERVEVRLNGVHGETLFPRQIELVTFRGPTQIETMLLTIRSVNLDTTCADSHFPLR